MASDQPRVVAAAQEGCGNHIRADPCRPFGIGQGTDLLDIEQIVPQAAIEPESRN